MNRLRLFVGWFHNRSPSPIHNRVQKQGNGLKLTATKLIFLFNKEEKSEVPYGF